MSNRKEMLDFALTRMSGFTLEGSSEGDNRSIFGLIRTLIQSVPGETLADCRKPLTAILGMRAFDQRKRFQGSKITLLQQTITALFGDYSRLLMGKEFAMYDREALLEYLEVCRRIFVSKYALELPGTEKARAASSNEPKSENAMERAFRLAMERSGRKGDRA